MLSIAAHALRYTDGAHSKPNVRLPNFRSMRPSPKDRFLGNTGAEAERSLSPWDEHRAVQPRYNPAANNSRASRDASHLCPDLCRDANPYKTLGSLGHTAACPRERRMFLITSEAVSARTGASTPSALIR